MELSLRHRGKRPPTDYELLRAIYEHHHDDWVATRASTTTGVALPIDLYAIAATLGTNPDTVFGRLYHHLDPKYGEPRDKKGRIALFVAQPGDVPDLINFPLLEAVLADLWQEHDRQRLTLCVSTISIAIALAALIVSIVAATRSTAGTPSTTSSTSWSVAASSFERP